MPVLMSLLWCGRADAEKRQSGGVVTPTKKNVQRLAHSAMLIQCRKLNAMHVLTVSEMIRVNWGLFFYLEIILGIFCLRSVRVKPASHLQIQDAAPLTSEPPGRPEPKPCASKGLLGFK